MKKDDAATRRAASASAAPPTGVQNTPIVGGYALGTLFGQGAIPVAGAGGMLARIYESAPVRDALIRLARAPKGSPQEAMLMERAGAAIGAVLSRETAPAARTLNQPAALPLAADPGEQQQQDQAPPQP